MRKYFFLLPLILAIPFVFIACDVHKKAWKSKTDTALTEETETKTFRKGDTVHYEVPNVTLKDTTIYTYSRQGTTSKIVYDNQGNVSSVDCISAAIELYEKRRTELEQTEKNKAKEKTEEFDSNIVLYFVCGFVLILCFALYLLFVYVKNKTKLL